MCYLLIVSIGKSLKRAASKLSLSSREKSGSSQSVKCTELLAPPDHVEPANKVERTRSTTRSIFEQLMSTGCFKANLDTSTGCNGKYTMCTEKIVVYSFSIHMDISFHSNKSEKNNCLYSKNLNWKLEPLKCDIFLKIQLTILRLFEANMVSRVSY